MSQLNKPAPAGTPERDRLKTVFIIAAGVPGGKAAEPMAVYSVYYRGIVQPYQMTFKRWYCREKQILG